MGSKSLNFFTNLFKQLILLNNLQIDKQKPFFSICYDSNCHFFNTMTGYDYLMKILLKKNYHN